MNLAEFKAWFEGFGELLEGPPTEKQWKCIKEKIGKIEDAPPTPIHVFHDDWYRPWRRWYYNDVICSTGGSLHGLAQNAVASPQFNSNAAFRELGRAEARSMRKASTETI